MKEEVCPRCKSPMAKAKIRMRLARGSFLLLGWRCPKCREELFTPEQARAGERQAIEKGLWGPTLWLERKITTIGNRPAVVIPKDIAIQLKIASGEKIRIGVLDREIIIKPE